MANQVGAADEPLVILGNGSRGGAYVLRLAAQEPLQMAFGRFLQGKSIDIPAGDYVYIGSAMSQRRSGSLARRLLRHATRCDKRPFHPIRTHLHARFIQAGLADTSLQPPTQKKKHWHIDYLLDETAVVLTHVLAIRSQQRLESRIAQLFMSDPVTTIIQPGLGASDTAGETHLLRVTAVDTWWVQLPQKIVPLLTHPE